MKSELIKLALIFLIVLSCKSFSQISNEILFMDNKIYPDKNNLLSKSWLSETFYEWDNNNWVPASRTLYTKNSQNSNTEVRCQSWKNNAWVDSTRTLYTKDQNNNNLEILDQVWKNNSWENQKRWFKGYREEYFDNIIQSWKNGAWENDSCSSYNYPNINYSDNITAVWENGKWKNKNRFITRYKNPQFYTDTIYYWNGDNWALSSCTETIFTPNSYTIINKIKTDNGLENSIKRTKDTIFKWNGTEWIYDTRYVYNKVQAGATGTIFYESLEEKWINNIWTTINKYKSTVDSIQKKTMLEMFLLREGSLQLVYRVSRNCDNDLDMLETISENFLNGRWINTSKTVYTYANVLDIQDNIKMPSGYELSQNYPNPFNPSTNIKFNIPQSSFVSLRIYNALGMEVDVLVNEVLNSGLYEKNWDAKGISSGIYFYRLKTGNYTETKKMILLR